MKIALISTEKLPVPPVAGGAVQIYIEGILPYLSKEHEITVFTARNEMLKDEEIVDGVRFIRVNQIPKEVYIENVLEQLGNEYHHIHVFNRPKWIRLISDKLPEVKISLSLHNEMFKPKKIGEVEAAECIKRVEFINAVSKFVADGVINLYPEAASKFNVIYSGADLQKYKTAWSSEGSKNKFQLAQKYGIKGDKVVLFVGRVNQKKGVDVLLKAMKYVIARYPKTALVVIGSNWFGENKETKYIQELRELAEEIPGKIIFTGFLTPDEVCRHYNLADVFVCPSQWNEPLARVHYEAMAAGVPIVTTNRGGNAEAIRGYANGFIVSDYNNPIAMARNIAYLIKYSNRAKRIGQNGRRAAENYFNFKRTAAQIAMEFKMVEQKLKL